jgi:hypothetical protein
LTPRIERRSVSGVRRALFPLIACLVLALGAGTAEAVAPPLYKNCTNFNKRYPHGVGKLVAKDRTSGEPVTNFRRSTPIYNTAMRWNRGLDRDKDGVACEKH